MGSALEVQQSDHVREASVTQISEKELFVQLSKPEVTSPFKDGEQVRIKYWDKQGIYFCNAEVAQVSGPGNQPVELSIVTRPVAMQRRRSFRLPHEIDVWLEVVDAIHGGLPPGKVIKSKTLDISGTGLSLETDAPLKVMDELKVSFHLSKKKKVDRFATVVFSEKVQKNLDFPKHMHKEKRKQPNTGLDAIKHYKSLQNKTNSTTFHHTSTPLLPTQTRL